MPNPKKPDSWHDQLQQSITRKLDAQQRQRMAPPWVSRRYIAGEGLVVCRRRGPYREDGVIHSRGIEDDT